MSKLIFLIIGMVIGGLAVYGFVSERSYVNPGSMMGRNGISQDQGEIDAHFIEQMIPHHEDAITMSELALEKATRPEVKELATNIISSQSKEITQMKAWYKDWYGRELPTGDEVMQHHGMMSGSQMHMGMMGGDMDLTNLENSEDFDRAFVEDMIPHHQMAVMMASMLKNGTDRPEMKKLADDIILAQTSEIDLMRKWLTEWE
ncbi:MAG: DUF305 domain-containing protein [Candidatus Levybacteria bacterium]|nr:DUF305 domain-containing protein [Candidatus Levybacteria bacterium]